MQPPIAFTGVSFGQGGFNALDKVNLRWHPSQLVGR